MSSTYKGHVTSETVEEKGKNKFDWVALLVWLGSLVLSLLPIYLSVLHYLNVNKTIDLQYCFKCITQDDILWVFGTVLLFSLVNCFVSRKKGNDKKEWVGIVLVLGVIVFCFLEGTWIFFKYSVTEYATWPIVLGSILMILTLIISTPLQIDFIKDGE